MHGWNKIFHEMTINPGYADSRQWDPAKSEQIWRMDGWIFFVQALTLETFTIPYK